MEKRKLASVQYVHHITPIEGADRIEWMEKHVDYFKNIVYTKYGSKCLPLADGAGYK